MASSGRWMSHQNRAACGGGLMLATVRRWPVLSGVCISLGADTDLRAWGDGPKLQALRAEFGADPARSNESLIGSLLRRQTSPLSFDQFVDGRDDRLAPPAIGPRQEPTLLQPVHRPLREASSKERTDHSPCVATIAMLQQPAPYRRIDLVLVHRNGEAPNILPHA
jgi:hypothetical protein